MSAVLSHARRADRRRRAPRVPEAAAGGDEQDPRHQQHRRDHAGGERRCLRAVQCRPPHHLLDGRGQAVDRLQGEDRPQLVQGPEAADRRALDRRLRRARQEDRQHQGRLRRERAARAQLQPALPAGGRQAHRLPHQADAGGADPRSRLERADRRDPDHQQQGRRAVRRARRRGRRRARRRRWPSPSSSARSRRSPRPSTTT